MKTATKKSAAKKSEPRPKQHEVLRRERTNPLALIESQLNAYAERGVFRSFSRTALENGIAEFRFFWLLNLSFRMTFDTKRNVIIFKKLLPAVEPGSTLETELKAFLAACQSPQRPEHRRVDPAKMRVSYANRAKSGTLTIKSLDADWETTTRKSIHLLNEVFLNFLNARHPEYMIATFQLPDE